ncbi:TetR/AcrR family transcriptional regulator C-terminal domain-containing protein [Desertihabitans aurantiacus]|uniref:TetR/AcrR family transcriptional regulator C-terminal domain-containing protein n=1 Tax=Desertihabitans aurantiacus TaxID=2282477 RepID=UPI000DF7B43A|nr:TetR/AcrR family transcriptional regulator C-terminal domain-containing protein [Desertihabitans aurantiacus]
MRHRRQDVVDRALLVLDDYGLADLTVRRLARELGVQPSALYHHVRSKQELLALVAEELLRRGPRRPRTGGWHDRLRTVCADLRDALLAYRDGAEVVAAAQAFGLGAAGPAAELAEVLRAAGAPEELARVGAATCVHYVLGHVGEEQLHLQAGSAGAIDADPRRASTFALGVDLVVDGIATRLPDPVVAPAWPSPG